MRQEQETADDTVQADDREKCLLLLSARPVGRHLPHLGCLLLYKPNLDKLHDALGF